jgi:hypothetical protein
MFKFSVLRSTLHYFGLLIFVIRLYGKGRVHTGYIIFCYWLSVCHIALYFPPVYFLESVLYWPNLSLMWTAVLYTPHVFIIQNDLKLFLKDFYLTAWSWFFSGLKQVAVFQWKWADVLDEKSVYFLCAWMQLGLHCSELHTILFRMHVFWDVMLCQWLNGSQHFKGWNTRKVGISVPCTWTILDPLCSPYIHVLGSPAVWTKCSILPTEMSLKSPGFIQWRPRYPNLIWPKPHSHKDASQMPVCICQHSGLCTSPSLNSCPFKLLCPVSSPVTLLAHFYSSWVILQLVQQKVF